MNAISKPARRGPRILLALFLGAAAAAGVYLYVNNIQQTAQLQTQRAVQQVQAAAPSVAKSKAVVAKLTISQGAVLTQDNVELRDIVGDPQPNAATSVNDVMGKTASIPFSAGAQILLPFVGTPDGTEAKKLADLVPAGKRAMSVTFTEVNSAGGLLQAGDYVDVIGVFNRNTLGKDESMLLLQDVLVLAVGAQSSSTDASLRQGAAANAPVPSVISPPARGGSATVAQPQATVGLPTVPAQTRTITLAVDAEAAERLALAEDYGHLRYVVRPGSERTQSSIVPADLTTLASPIQVAAGQIIATEISPTNVSVGDTIDIKITVKNTSDKPLQTMEPHPDFTYVQGQTYFTQGYATDPGKWRVGIGSAGLDSTDLPYRWGLGGDLAPGATTTVTGHVKVTQDFKATNFWAALISEPNTIQSAGTTLITSLPQNLAIVAVDAANVRSSPSIAASVLDQVKYGTELQIVGQSADWFKVKLPDQREGWVAAGWIVTASR